MSRKFIKKPLEIEAFRFGYDMIPRWGEKGEIKYFMHHAIISTLEGDMTANQGDYIIKGIKGEIYPCKADIFEASYDEVPCAYVAKVSGLDQLDPNVWATRQNIIPSHDE